MNFSGKEGHPNIQPRPGWESNWGPQDWEAEILTTAPTPPLRIFLEYKKVSLDNRASLISFMFYCQHHARGDGRTHESNLGVLLIEFFELYGNNFNYVNTGISVKSEGSYFSKQEVSSWFPLLSVSVL